MPYYEDFELGKKMTTLRKTITDGIATILISVAGYPAPIFNDEITASKTPLGWRVLPGPIGLALLQGLAEQKHQDIGHEGEGALVGANNVSWKAPIKVGDTIYCELETVEKRRTKNPKWGLTVEHSRLFNQKGELLLEGDIVHVWEYRPNK
jgi:acyl dehydratase